MVGFFHDQNKKVVCLTKLQFKIFPKKTYMGEKFTMWRSGAAHGKKATYYPAHLTIVPPLLL